MTTRMSDLVSAPGFTVGRHTLEINSVEMKTAKNGNPQLQIKATDEDGNTANYWRPLILSGLGFVANDFLAIDANLELPDEKSEWPAAIFELYEEHFVGRSVDVDVVPKKQGSGNDVVIKGPAGGESSDDDTPF